MSGTLLAPAWLAALAAVVVPVVLHLFGRGAARRIAVGSIRLVGEVAPRRSRLLRPSDPWLLLLRCGLLAVVAIAVAGPRVWRPIEAGREGWVLVDPELMAARATLQGTIQSGDELAILERLEAVLGGDLGDRVRWLAPGLPAFDPATPPESADGGVDPWSLLRAADRTLPPGLPITLFSLDRLATMRGARPTVARPVTWHTVGDPRGNGWIERVVTAPTAPAASVAIVGHGTSARTVYHRAGVAPGAVARVTEPDPWPDDDVQTPIAGSALAIQIVAAPGREVDADRVRAAVRASAELAGIPIDLVSGSPEEAAPAPAKVVFWLGDTEPPAELRASLGRAGGTLVEDGGPRARSCVGRIEVAAPHPGVLGLWRCASAAGDDDRRVVVWRDPTGLPLLDAVRVDGLLHYRYHSRFHPGWSDLVDGSVFAPWVHGIVDAAAGEEGSARRRDSERRRALPGEWLPRIAEPTAAQPTAASAWPETLLWLLAAVLLVVERWRVR